MSRPLQISGLPGKGIWRFCRRVALPLSWARVERRLLRLQEFDPVIRLWHEASSNTALSVMNMSAILLQRLVSLPSLVVLPFTNQNRNRYSRMQGTDSSPNTPPPEYESTVNPSLRTRSPLPHRSFQNGPSVDESYSSMDVTFRSQPPDYSSARTDPPAAYLSPPNIVLHDEAREIEKSGDLRAGSISLNRVTKYIVTGDVIAYEDVEVDDMCHFQIGGNAVFGDDLEISSNSILEVKGDAK